MAGYSGTPLITKLGIKPGFNVVFVNAPAGFIDTLELPKDVVVHRLGRTQLDFVLLFVKSQNELKQKFSPLAAKLTPSGMLWVSWPKKTSGVQSDLNENIVRDIGLAKMVDVKICAIDDVWSGLKFVFRLKDRPKK